MPFFFDFLQAAARIKSKKKGIAKRCPSFLKLSYLLDVYKRQPSMTLVEVIRGANTTQETFDFIYNLSKEIGKEPVEVAEAPGFVVNKILIPMINEAIGLVETGVASVEDIDKAMMLGANHPMGCLLYTSRIRRFPTIRRAQARRRFVTLLRWSCMSTSLSFRMSGVWWENA